ncbi:MAG: hypothetical protein ACLPVY_09990 [Acidimicrobiia bacterium]
MVVTITVPAAGVGTDRVGAVGTTSPHIVTEPDNGAGSNDHPLV